MKASLEETKNEPGVDVKMKSQEKKPSAEGDSSDTDDDAPDEKDGREPTEEEIEAALKYKVTK